MSARGLFAALIIVFGDAPASAVTTNASDDPLESSGAPVAQRFDDHGVSSVETGAGSACVLSQIIPIAEARYLAPDTHARVPFNEVVRSRATSFQIVAPRPGALAALPFVQVQLKYPVDRAAGAVLIGPDGLRLDLDDSLEPSGDVFRIVGDAAGAVIDTLENGRALYLAAVSADTGRRVEDRLRLGDDAEGAAAAFAALADCATALQVEASAREVSADDAGAETASGLVPSATITLDASLAPTASSLVTPEEALICGMADVDGPLHRGQAISTTGFILPSQTLYARYDEMGRLDALYAPGAFEAHREPSGAYRVSVSRAANGNTPLEPSVVSGCLGYDETTLCAYPDEDTGSVILARCVDEEGLFAIGEFPTFAAEGFDEGGLAGRSGAARTLLTRARPIYAGFLGSFPHFGAPGAAGLGPAIGGFSSGGGDGGGDARRSDPEDASTGPSDLTVIPLPASILLAASSAGLLAIFGLARRRFGDRG